MRIRAWTTLLAMALLPVGAAGCEMFKVKGFVKTTTMVDGKTETKEREFNSFAEMPQAFSAEGVDPKAALHAAVMSALQVDPTQELVAAGEQLITGAPASIINPKTALHVDLIVDGLKQSCELIAESGSLLVDIGSDLSPFG
jgi:hypothetical protein